MSTTPVSSALATQESPRQNIARSETVKLWMRLDGETFAAYNAFCCYRDMGVDRSYTLVAQKLDISRTLVARWASRWRWQKRITAYLHHLDADHLRKQRLDIQDMNARHRKLSLVFQEKIADRLKTLDVNDLTPQDLAKWAAVAVEIERGAFGLSKLVKFEQLEQVEAVLKGSPEVQTFNERLKQLSAPDREIFRELTVKYLRVMKAEFHSEDTSPDADKTITVDGSPQPAEA
jgi:hypothetical protein